MSLLIRRYCGKKCPDNKEIAEIEYLKMLDQGYSKLVRRYIKTRSAELLREMKDNEEDIEIAIININIRFIKKEIKGCQKKIHNDDNKVKGCHLSKRQKIVILERITNLKSDLKNLFKKRFNFYLK